MPPDTLSPGPCRVAAEEEGDQHHHLQRRKLVPNTPLIPTPASTPATSPATSPVTFPATTPATTTTQQPITLNDLLILAWQLDIDQATKHLSRDREADDAPSPRSTPSSPPPQKRRKMSSSPPKRRRQEYDQPDLPQSPPASNPHSSASTTAVLRPRHDASSSIPEADEPTITPISFVSLVHKLAASSTTPRSTTASAADDAATVSTNTSYFPPPTTASSARRGSQPTSRPPSPGKGGDRQKRVTLEFTRPGFKFGFPALSDSDSDSDADDEGGGTGAVPRDNPPVPAHVATLIRNLSEVTATEGCIPAHYAPLIARATHGAEYIPPYAFSPSTAGEGGTGLFRHAHNILTQAHRLHNTRAAEAGWYLVVRALLDGPPANVLPSPSTAKTPADQQKQPPLPTLTTEDSQTWLIAPPLLPLAGPRPIAFVKVDLTLQYARSGPVARALNPLFCQDPGVSLSAFQDPVAAKTFTAALVEVKSPGGDREEGEYQVVVAGAGVLARLEGLGAGEGEGKGWPVVGWVVQGHWWSLLVMYKEDAGTVRVLGPFPAGNTATYLGIFQVMGVVRRVKEWACTEYWGFLKGLVGGMGGAGTGEGAG